MEGIKVRPARLDDLETLLEFEQGIISAERPYDPTLKNDPLHYYDLQEMIGSEEVALLVAEVEGVVVGSGYARIEKSKMYYKHANHAYLGLMYVQPAFRGKGIIQKIIEALREWSLAKNITELRLEVYSGNLAALRAYEKIGFSNYMMQMRMGL